MRRVVSAHEDSTGEQLQIYDVSHLQLEGIL
jgi:hypothetical protein